MKYAYMYLITLTVMVIIRIIIEKSIPGLLHGYDISDYLLIIFIPVSYMVRDLIAAIKSINKS